MATIPDIGLDIAGITAPLVDLAFGIAGLPQNGGALVDVMLTLIGNRDYNPRTDDVASNDTVAPVPGLLFERSESETQAAPDVREAELLLNASDLAKAGVPAGVVPKQNDKVSINGTSWTVFQRRPIPTDTIYLLRIRR